MPWAAGAQGRPVDRGCPVSALGIGRWTPPGLAGWAGNPAAFLASIPPRYQSTFGYLSLMARSDALYDIQHWTDWH